MTQDSGCNTYLTSNLKRTERMRSTSARRRATLQGQMNGPQRSRRIECRRPDEAAMTLALAAEPVEWHDATPHCYTLSPRHLVRRRPPAPQPQRPLCPWRRHRPPAAGCPIRPRR